MCVRAGMRVIKPRYSIGSRSSTADLEKLFRGICPTYPLRHNTPDSLVVLSVEINPLCGQGGDEMKKENPNKKREDVSAEIL